MFGKKHSEMAKISEKQGQEPTLPVRKLNCCLWDFQAPTFPRGAVGKIKAVKPQGIPEL